MYSKILLGGLSHFHPASFQRSKRKIWVRHPKSKKVMSGFWASCQKICAATIPSVGVTVAPFSASFLRNMCSEATLTGGLLQQHELNETHIFFDFLEFLAIFDKKTQNFSRFSVNFLTFEDFWKITKETLMNSGARSAPGEILRQPRELFSCVLRSANHW